MTTTPVEFTLDADQIRWTATLQRVDDGGDEIITIDLPSEVLGWSHVMAIAEQIVSDEGYTNALIWWVESYEARKHRRTSC